MGPLHIEMALLSIIRDWLKGSGWLGIFNKARSAHWAELTASFREVMLKEADMAISPVSLPFARWHKKYFKHLVADHMKIGKTS